jgi:hypothetical protein
MMTRTLKMAAVAAAFASVPMIGAAADRPTALDNCVKAFMAELATKTPSTPLKLVDTHYRDASGVPDGNLRVLAGSSELTLTARDAHDNHPVARMVCTVSTQGDVLELHSSPVSNEPF